MLPLPHGETVTRLRAARVTDPYSLDDDQLDWTTVDELDIPGCVVYPASTSVHERTEEGRDQARQGLTLLAPPDPDIEPWDRVRVRGVVFEVDGFVFDYVHPMTGWRPGAQVSLQRWEG